MSVMSLLGHAAGAMTAGLDEVDALKNVACSLGLSADHFNWKSGTTARYENGGWNWPSGTTAKYENGGFNWPSGTTAKYTKGAWNWPSGTTAKYANGRFNDESGMSSTREQIVGPSCARQPRRCRELAELEAIDADLGMAAFLALSLSRER